MNNNKWLRIRLSLLRILKMKGKSTGEIVWSRGVIFGCVSVIVSIVFKLIRNDAEMSTWEYVTIGIVLYTFVYFSLSHYLHVKYAEVNIFKFIYISIAIAVIAIVINIASNYVFFDILGRRSLFINYRRESILEDIPNVSLRDLKEVLLNYEKSMTILSLLLRDTIIYISLAFLSSLVSFGILKSKLKLELINIKKVSKNRAKKNLESTPRLRTEMNRRSRSARPRRKVKKT